MEERKRAPKTRREVSIRALTNLQGVSAHAVPVPACIDQGEGEWLQYLSDTDTATVFNKIVARAGDSR